jgi:hypothetical protein
MAINGLTMTTSSGNISGDPLFNNYPSDVHLKAGSPCIGAGTPTGEPLLDMDFGARSPTKPSIGPDEF